MIASVSGSVLHRATDHVVVEAAGVGYMLSVSAHTLEAVPPSGAQVTLLATLVVREDAMQLYGFASGRERELFTLLTGVSGVGPKVALAVLSGLSVADAERALVLGDSEAFQKVPGIGKRTAERLIVELKDKVLPSGEPSVVRAADGPGDALLLARDGLLALGYSLADAESMLSAASAGGATSGDSAASSISAEQLIQSALRQVAS